MLQLCMNPGNIKDWSILDGDNPIATSDFGTFETKDQTEESFDAIVALAKADAIPFDYYEFDGQYSLDEDADLHFLNDFPSVEELKADFDKVIAFLKDQ